MDNNSDEVDLFAAPAHDDLHAEIAKGSFQWTNKYTRYFLVFFGFVLTLSLGAWYGHRAAVNAQVASSSSARSAFAAIFGGSGSGGSGSGGSGSGASGFGASGFGGSGFGGSGFGGSGASTFSGGGFAGGGSRGAISAIKGNSVTVTLNTPPTTLKVGDNVSLRASQVGGGFSFGAGSGSNSANSGARSYNPNSNSNSNANANGATAANGSANNSKNNSGSSAKTSGQTGTSRPSVNGVGSGQGGSGQGGSGQGGRSGGFFSNPAFTQCLAGEGVTLTPGVRPDRNDPKVMAALQACFAKLGGPGGAGGGQGGYGNRNSGANSTTSGSGSSATGSTSSQGSGSGN